MFNELGRSRHFLPIHNYNGWTKPLLCYTATFILLFLIAEGSTIFYDLRHLPVKMET